MKALLISIIALLFIGCNESKDESNDDITLLPNKFGFTDNSVGFYYHPTAVSMIDTVTIEPDTVTTTQSCNQTTYVFISSKERITIPKGKLVFTMKRWTKIRLPDTLRLYRNISDSTVIDTTSSNCTPLSKAKILLKLPYGKSGEYLTVRAVDNKFQVTDTLTLDTMFNFNKTPFIINMYKTLWDVGHLVDKGEFYESLKVGVNVDNNKGIPFDDIERMIKRKKVYWRQTKTYEINGKTETMSRLCGESYPYLNGKGEIYANEPTRCKSNAYNIESSWTWDDPNGFGAGYIPIP